jgi:hypothetical protein
MCPIYKKKDRTEISNYWPITLLNTDYKLLTKVQWVKKLSQCLAVLERLTWHKLNKLWNNLKIIYIILGHLSF